MLSLETKLNSLNFATQLNEVRDLLHTAQAKMTFWGCRVVTVNGFSGSVAVADIASKVLRASYKRCDDDDLTLPERIAGIEIVKKINGFYFDTDTHIQHANSFTKCFSGIREFSLTPYTTRFFMGETAEGNFRAYSKAKFLQQFGGQFKRFDDHPASDGSFGPPLRIVAREDRIREQLAKPAPSNPAPVVPV
jgi:hypothetical protein